MDTRKLIYCVEDEKNIRELVVYALNSSDFRAEGFEDGETFRDGMKKAMPDLVLLDIIMPGMDGWAVFQEMKKINAQVKVIITSGYGITHRKKRILTGTPHGTLQKPYPRTALARMIAKVLALPAPAGAFPGL